MTVGNGALVHEQAVVINCEGAELLGVLSGPPAAVPPTGIGIAIIVGGPQYRAGSHRQFVLLARALAAQGHQCLRFDYRGMGDSSGTARDFLDIDADISAAVNTLHHHPNARAGIVLFGLCDAASAALKYMNGPGANLITALAVANPWVRAPATLAQTQLKHYYGKRVLSAEFWQKLLRGNVGPGALIGLIRSVGAACIRKRPRNDSSASSSFQEQMLEGLARHNRPTLLLLSGNDYVAKEFLLLIESNAHWKRAMDRPNMARHEIPTADHTFSTSADWEQAIAIVVSWLGDLPDAAENGHKEFSASEPIANPSRPVDGPQTTAAAI